MTSINWFHAVILLTEGWSWLFSLLRVKVVFDFWNTQFVKCCRRRIHAGQLTVCFIYLAMYNVTVMFSCYSFETTSEIQLGAWYRLPAAVPFEREGNEPKLCSLHIRQSEDHHGNQPTRHIGSSTTQTRSTGQGDWWVRWEQPENYGTHGFCEMAFCSSERLEKRISLKITP